MRACNRRYAWSLKAPLAGLFNYPSLLVVQTKWLDSLNTNPSPSRRARDVSLARIDLVNARARYALSESQFQDTSRSSTQKA